MKNINFFFDKKLLIFFMVIYFSSCNIDLIEPKKDLIEIASHQTKAWWWGIDRNTIKSVFNIEGALNYDFALDLLVNEMEGMRGILEIIDFLETVKPPIKIIFDSNVAMSNYHRNGYGENIITINKFSDIQEELLHAYIGHKISPFDGMTPYTRKLNAELDVKLYAHFLTNFNWGGTSELDQYEETSILLEKYGYTLAAMEDNENRGREYYIEEEHYRAIYQAFKRDIAKKNNSPYAYLTGSEYYTGTLDLIFALINSPYNYL